MIPLSIHKHLRRRAIHLLSVFGDRDASIRHHWVDGKLKLNLFRHRGYWWKGRKREQQQLEVVSRIVKPGNQVIELGGHIGYITMLLSQLAGPEGRVLVYEPSPGNLKYLRQNTSLLENVEIVPKAVSDGIGEVPLYEEGLSGQNNSIVAGYEIFERVRAGSGLNVEVTERQVECTTLDSEIAEKGLKPDFIKIDIEGAELMALRGALHTLKTFRPVIMIELSRSVEECLELFTGLGYNLVSPTGRPFAHPGKLAALYAFALPEEKAEALRECFVAKADP